LRRALKKNNFSYDIDGVSYNVLIVKKASTRNTYLRVKDDLTIYVTTSIFEPDFLIKQFIYKNDRTIRRMINERKKEKEFNSYFYYLGKKYNVVRNNSKTIEIDGNDVFIGNVDIDNWFRKQAKTLYKEKLDYWYSIFSRKIPYPSLVIRKMKTRWGVCNIKTHIITLNLELMKREEKYLDYVIVHELSHLIHPDHSPRFWDLVGENFPKYKECRKEMKDF
jgi:predicted metal-dependent hydrolase